jgi:CRP-like cAMP-binding protein
MQPTTALVWDYAVFQSIMRENPQVGRNTSLVLASRLNELEERFREVATEKVARRIALALLRLLKHIGKTVHGGVEVSLSREELAQMTGTTLFTTSRVLSKWGEMGFVLPRRESVLVCDRNRLELASEDI